MNVRRPVSSHKLRCGRGRRVAAAVFFALVACLAAAARPDSDPPLKIHPLFVDANDPSAWPKGLEPVSAAELQRLIGPAGGQRVGPPAAQIERAVYHATFREGRLCEGQAHFVIANSGANLALVPLGEPSLELADPQWQPGDDSPTTTAKTEEALWGFDSAGQRVLISEPGRSRLSCKWSLAGRSVLGTSDFTLVLPPSVVSQVFVAVPDEWTINCSTGAVSPVLNPARRGETVWKIELGSRSTCRLRIERKPGPAVKPSLFFDQDTAYVVSAEKLQIQSKLQFDVFTAPLSAFKLTAPPALRVETISCADVPLAFQSHVIKEAQEIEVILPEPLLGKGRTIVVEASTASLMNRMWRLPRIDVPGAVRRDGQVALTIGNPLKLLQFGGDTAVAELEAPAYGADGEETFKLRDADHERPILIKVGEPTPTLTISMLQRLDLLRDQCVLRADVVCAASGGSAFSVECEMPEAWDVTDVQAVGDVARVSHWTGRTAALHKRRVKIDFYRAVTEREPQRFRIEAARPVPRTGETINLPVLSFPGLRTGDLQTIVTHAPAIDLALDPANAFIPLAQTVISPAFTNSPLLPDATQSTDERIVVERSTLPNEKARITLRRGEQGFAARVQTRVDLEASQMTQRIAAFVTPEAGPVDRLFIYLTSEGPPLTWLLVSERPRPLEASRIPAGRHSEWNLPVSGELWEIRIPDPQRTAFRLEGARKTSGETPGEIALAFLPGARSFSGTVEVRFANALQFRVEAFGPQSVRPSDEHLPADVRSESRVVRTWSYDRPTDSLVIRPRGKESPRSVVQIAALDLHSWLYAGGTGDDLHKAVFVLSPLPGTRPFRFTIDSAARLTSIAVNGRVVRVQHHDDVVTVPSLPSDRWNRVEILYKTSSLPGRFREERQVVFPRAEDAEVYQFRWWFALPPGIQPGEPAGSRLAERLPALSWSEKLFGPLGRPAAEASLPSFAEAPWLSDFGFQPNARPDVFAEIDPERPALTWTVWHASADAAPRSLAVPLWHESELRTLAWIVYFGCLAVGLAVQRWQLRLRQPLAFAVVAAAGTLTLIAPGLSPLPLGACVAGTLLAILIGVSWASRPVRAAAAATSDRSRSGSTATFEYRPILLLLGMGAVWTAVAYGTDTTPGPSVASPASGAAALSDLLVVIPTRVETPASTKPLPDAERLLYVPRAALETLWRVRGERHGSDAQVFLSSQYAVSFDERQTPTVEARFKVAVTSPDETEIRLPLSNVTLAGAHACRINGRPYPVRQTDDAFVLNLTGTPAFGEERANAAAGEPEQPRRPVEAARPQPVGLPNAAGGPVFVNRDTGLRARLFEITLHFFPENNGAIPAPGFEFGVPKTASSTLRIERPGPRAQMIVETDRGQVAKLRAGADATIELGDTDVLRFLPGSPLPPSVPLIEGRATQFVRVSPELIEIDCRATYAASQNGLDHLEWMIPAGAVARASDESFRIARGAPTADGRWVPLKFALPARPTRPVTLAVKLMIPVGAVPAPDREPHRMIPLVRFAGGLSAGVVRLLSNQVGVTAIPGYRTVVLTNEPNLAHTSAADPAFRQDWHGGGRKEPEFILEAHGLTALPVELVPLVPSHKVRITDEARFSADRLSWKTTAEIRVEHAPAFVHRLRVDPRMKIESISIAEDNVERLVRYSRSGQDVTLFLRDRAAATQDLILLGSMPIEPGRDTKLPSVSLVGATVTDARLLLESNPQIDIAVTNAPQPGAPHEDRSDEHALRRAREYILASDGSLPTVRVTQRAQQPRSASVTVLTPEGAKSINVGVYLRLAGTRLDEGPFEIILPQEVAARSKIVANVEKQIRRNSDGTWGVLLEAHPARDSIVQIQWNETPERATWTLPSLSITNAATSEGLLLVADSIAWRPEHDSRMAPSGSGPPEWMRRELPDGVNFNAWTLAAAEPTIWRLTRPAAAPVREATARIYASVDLSADGSSLGSLFLLTEQQSGSTLGVRWPAGAVLRAALLDGRPLQPLSEKDGQLVFATGPEGRRHRVAIHWAVSSERRVSGIQKISEEIPFPVNLDAKTMLLAVSAPAGFRMLSPTNFQALGPSLFADEAEPIVTLGGQTPATDASGREAAPSYSISTGGRLLGRLAIDRNSRSIQFWILPESFMTIFLAIAGFALVFGLLYRVSVSRPAVWLADHQPLTLAIVGTAWSLCLSPRVVGIAMVVASLFWFASRRRARKPLRANSLPNTVHLPA